MKKLRKERGVIENCENKTAQGKVIVKKSLSQQKVIDKNYIVNPDHLYIPPCEEFGVNDEIEGVRDKLASEVSTPGLSESFMDSHDITEQESASLGTYDNLSSSKEIDYTHTNQYDVGIHQKPKSLKPFPVKCNDDDTFKIPSRNNSAALAVDKSTDLASRTYDLRSKLSKAANSSASPVPDSFSRKLDLFLKEIRQQTNSTF